MEPLNYFVSRLFSAIWKEVPVSDGKREEAILIEVLASLHWYCGVDVFMEEG